MEKLMKILPSLIFNIAETTVIALIGTLLNVPISSIIIILLSFILTRTILVIMYSKKAFHFRTWYRCLIWSTLIMLSLFVLLKVDLYVSITFAMFAGYIMTTTANITRQINIKNILDDIYLWKSPSEPGKYQDIEDYVKYNEYSDKLMEFENKIKSKSDLDYLIYKYKFLDHKTFSKMNELLGMDNPRIDEHLERIALAIRLYCGI